MVKSAKTLVSGRSKTAFQTIDGTSTKLFLGPEKHGVFLLFHFRGFGSLDVALELIHRRMVSPVIWTEESVLGGGRF